jgi:aminoglycoside phosphotransferase family enzyme
VHKLRFRNEIGAAKTTVNREKAGGLVIKDALHMPDIEAKLKFLQTPEAYGESGQKLQCIETHMSWVFLIGNQVFKLKKPVRFPFLDFTTLSSREFYCREEVRLNARLAPGIYLGLMALQRRDGTFALVPETRLHLADAVPGEIVDWLVWMQQLPAHRMLHQLIAEGHAEPQDIDALIEVLGAFYRAAPVAPVSPNDYLARFQYEQASTREVLLRPQFQLRDAALAIDRLGSALSQGADLLRDRALHKRVLDGHGDLRPEHVCLIQPPVVIDCLEFNRQLRQVDPFEEVAYLGLECDMAGAPWIGQHLTSGCAAVLNDHPPAALMCLYTAHRALMRARLTLAHLLDPQPCTPEKWPPLAARYIGRALVALDTLAQLTNTRSFIATRQHGLPQ